MAIINIDNAHKPLIQQAIKLGDWLLSLDGLSKADQQAINSIQQALKSLPKIKDGTLAMYGFSLEQGDEMQGLVRGWDVSLEYFANDPEQQGGLELFSSYIPIPETTDQAILAEKKQSEVYFYWPVGGVCNFIQPEQAKRWINEVAQPLNNLQAAERVRVEIVYQDYYSEIEISDGKSD